jgi:hypothetical protein
MCELDLFGAGYGPITGSCGKGNKLAGSIKAGLLLDPKNIH